MWRKWKCEEQSQKPLRVVEWSTSIYHCFLITVGEPWGQIFKVRHSLFNDLILFYLTVCVQEQEFPCYQTHFEGDIYKLLKKGMLSSEECAQFP